MSEIKMTNAIATILKGYGWNFYEHHRSRLSSGWTKYEGGQLVAVMGDPIWDRDVEAALCDALPGMVVVDPKAAQSLVEGHLSQSVIDGLTGMGWQWTRTCFDGWEWMKFIPNGTCTARQGGRCWKSDLESVRLLAAAPPVEESVPGIEVWKVTPELRQRLTLPDGMRLEQKWVREDDGRPEWRDVPYCDHNGEILV